MFGLSESNWNMEMRKKRELLIWSGKDGIYGEESGSYLNKRKVETVFLNVCNYHIRFLWMKIRIGANKI